MGAIARFFGFLNVCVATTAGFLLLMNAATAATQPVIAPSATPSRNAPADILKPAPSSMGALNWAGYVADGGTYTYVSGTWNVPSVSAGPNEADATWVGIGGTSSHDLIQVGTEAIGVDSGVAYQPWYELLPDSSYSIPVAIHSGDSVTASITEVKPGKWLISFSNNTTGKSWSTTKDYASSRTSAEWIEEVPSAVGEHLTLDDFGVVNFKNGYAIRDGIPVNIQKSGARALTMMSGDGVPAAIPSVLGADGQSFSVARRSGVEAAALTVSELDLGGSASAGVSGWRDVSVQRHQRGWDDGYYIIVNGL